MNCIFFDIEGPLTPNDNAYELMQLFEGGAKIFEAISRYDDILTLEKRPNYQPGDTLRLILPFLINHNISKAHIIKLAEKSNLIEGARNLIDHLKKLNWEIFCISTSYNHFALKITEMLGVAKDHLACTIFPSEKVIHNVNKNDLKVVSQLENEIIHRKKLDDNYIKSIFDHFYYCIIPSCSLNFIYSTIKPVGGINKVNAIIKFANKYGINLKKCIAVGDSITDCQMLEFIVNNKGIGIVFNGNEYIIPFGTIGLASTNIYDLKPLIEIIDSSNFNLQSIKHWITQKEKHFGETLNDNFSWLVNKSDLSNVIAVHKKIRKIVRHSAAKLG